MERISVKKKIDRIIITHKIEKNEQINTMELDIVNKREIPALLPVNIKRSLFGKKVQFVVQSLLDLRSYLKSGIRFDQFAEIILQIIDALQKCESHGIRCGNLELDSDLAFFDYSKQRVRLIYWPMISLSSYSSVSTFFLELGSIYTSKNHDDKYRVSYLQFFDSRAKFNLEKFKEYIVLLNKDWHAAQMGGAGKHSHEKAWSSDKKDDTGKKIGHTVSLHSASIHRVSTKSTIDITRYPFCIGRKAEFCDYALEDNQFVSKRHASILMKDGQAYIRDNGSANGTYLNDKRLVPNCEVLLSSGATFRIGNEEFVFHAAGG